MVTDGHVPDEVYEEVRLHFSEKELSDLTLAVATINAWNRLLISSRTVPGEYQPAMPKREEKSASMIASGGDEDEIMQNVAIDSTLQSAPLLHVERRARLGQSLVPASPRYSIRVLHGSVPSDFRTRFRYSFRRATAKWAGVRSRARHDTLVQQGWSALRQRYFRSADRT